MARTSEPHSATAQFFINVADNAFLDYKGPSPQGWGYCVFGKVADGEDVVDRITRRAHGHVGRHQDVPREDVVIMRAEEVGVRSRVPRPRCSAAIRPLHDRPSGAAAYAISAQR